MKLLATEDTHIEKGWLETVASEVSNEYNNPNVVIAELKSQLATTKQRITDLETTIDYDRSVLTIPEVYYGVVKDEVAMEIERLRETVRKMNLTNEKLEHERDEAYEAIRNIYYPLCNLGIYDAEKHPAVQRAMGKIT